jgi:cytochrome c oxidase cbb3-type subunit 3
MLHAHFKSSAAVRCLNKGLALLAPLLLFVATDRAEEHAAPRGHGQTREVKQEHDEGRQAFESRCAGCHGLDGRGGERAPDVATRASARRRSDAELFQIIQNGIPARGMPSFATMDSSRIHALVSYLRLLQGKSEGASVSGDPQQGKALFFGKARCSDCHMVDGAGGFIAADLSTYGRTRAPEEIRAAITSKQKNRSGTASGLTTVTLSDGQKFSGIVRNEDNFCLQLQTLDGAFHLLTKAELQSLTRSSEPLMPFDYGSTLNRNEIDVLISFLVNSSRGSETSSASGTKEKRSEKKTIEPRN